jgi:peptidoglycan/xylan/chitin deacetylase (PgdA/CDA1 family)
MYHRVVERIPNGLYDPALFVTAATFEMHIREISKFFRIVSLDDLKGHWGSKWLCAITFDDGWIDNYHIAFPILKAYQVPATVFLPAGLMGTKKCFWYESLWDLANQARNGNKESVFIHHFREIVPQWNPLSLTNGSLMTLTSILKTNPPSSLENLIENAWGSLCFVRNSKRITIDWNEAEEMGQYGIAFGSHGVNHHILTSLDSAMKKMEIVESMELIRSRNIPVAPWFSYPNGNWDEESISFLSEAGYKGAITTRLGCCSQGTNPFLMNRVGLHDSISNTSPLLWFRLFQAIIAGRKASFRTIPS